MIHDNMSGPHLEITPADRKDYGKCFYKAPIYHLERHQYETSEYEVVKIDPKELPAYIEKAQETLARMGITP